MKKVNILALLLVFVMLGTCGCGTTAGDKTTVDSNQPEAVQSGVAEPSSTAKTGPEVNKKVALILQQGGLGDQGFNDTAYAGLKQAKVSMAWKSMLLNALMLPKVKP